MARLEQYVYQSDNSVFPADSAKKLVEAYQACVNKCPADTMAGEYLFKAGEVAVTLQEPDTAVKIYHRLYTEFRNHQKGPMGLFLEAFTYDNQLHDFEKARALYEQFIKEFPDHEFADDAQGSLDNLGIPVEELIKKWEQQDSAKSNGEGGVDSSKVGI